jgi:hypothetical protein
VAYRRDGGECRGGDVRPAFVLRPAQSTARQCSCALPTQEFNGVANSSGMVGRYYMNHNCTAIWQNAGGA